MTVLHAKSALMPSGWEQDVTVTIGSDGRISSLAATPAEVQVDILLPAPANVHSHAFQRAMAGLTERRSSAEQDSFWTWRQMMYRFLDHLTPDDVQAIAALVQMEMLEAGFASVGEFHYLHHQPGGTPYSDVSEMSQRICAAAQQTGIGMTLLPVLYQQGGVDGRNLAPGQIRFGNTTDQFQTLLAGARAAIKALPADATLGVAPHSLRAVTPAALTEVTGYTSGPVHMHLAEQVAEVDEIEAAYGMRPVEWLLNNQPPDERWCLIHCTQMQPDETASLAATGAVAGLCPITESSLGDGIFDGAGWFAANGATAIGSDSNIRIALAEELRQLEYSQRLRDKARAVLAPPGCSTARSMYDSILSGGAQALGRASGSIAIGQLADLVALDGSAPDLTGRQDDTVLDSWVFAIGDSLVRELWSAGRHVVHNGQHFARDMIIAGYRKTLARLAEVM